jgi:hypothetical protein
MRFFHLLIVLICGSSHRIYPTDPPSLPSEPPPEPKTKTQTSRIASTSTTASAAAAALALSELQAQLHNTQTSLASHVDKMRALDAEHDAINHEGPVSVVGIVLGF